MRARVLVLLTTSLASAALAAEPRKVLVPRATEDILRKMEISSETSKVALLGQVLATRDAKTEAELTHLLGATVNPAIAPYAQMAISKTTEPSLGVALDASLVNLKAGLRRMSPDEIRAGPSPEWKTAEGQALKTAAVIHALGAMKYRGAAPLLRELLNYDDALNAPVAWEASQALAAMGDEEGFSMMMDRVGKNKPISISGFGTRGIRKIVEKIDSIDATTKDKALRFGDPRHRQITDLADELRNIRSKDPDVKEALRQLLYHKYQRVQWGASIALAENLDQKDKKVSLEMLRHKDFFVRKHGLDSLILSKTWDKSCLPILIAVLQHDPNDEVRAKAARTLAALPPAVPHDQLKEAVPYLQEALRDESRLVRYQAFDALRVISGKFYSYEGMPDDQRDRMTREPADRYAK